MHRLTRRLSVLAVLVVGLLVAAVAQASEAQSFLKNKQDELMALIKKDSGAKLDTLFDQILDYDTLARDSLADEWDKRSPEERAEFQRLLTGLVRESYRKNLKRTVDYTIEFKGESKVQSGVLVQTVAKNRGKTREEPVSIDYVLHQVGGVWRIADIVTDGSSLVQNYRNQFRRILRKQGFPELLRKMKSKLDKGDTD
jgi:phospholipid transport system substrate-binding protein